MLLLAAFLLAVITAAPIVLALDVAFVVAAVVALRRAVVVSDEQPLALAALVAFRAPPA